MTCELKKNLDTLKDRLARYDAREIRRARDSWYRHRVRNRCFSKLKEIDAEFGVCRGVKVFLDLCGGPGQFAEYIFSVNDNADCIGYGATLRNECDYTFSHPNFRKMYGCFDTGDIFDANVQFELMYFCRGKCDLVVADGAFDVTGRENDQEAVSLQLIGKECSIILEALRVGGDCVLKIFDTFDDSTISLLDNFTRHFAEYHLFKPRHSRAANSEKYLVCKGKLTKAVAASQRRRFDAQTVEFAHKQRLALERLLAVLENAPPRRRNDKARSGPPVFLPRPASPSQQLHR